ncbi:MAG TPA: tetratricopeptide repeat protein, partial [Rhodothermales bacterium]|nr:tetratricopeptide repeat protein [Rhodothermales bacterium]
QEGVHQWAADNFALAREGHTDDLAMRATYYEAVNRVLADQKRPSIPLFAAVADQWPASPLADHALYEKGMVEYELRMWSDANTTFSRLLNEYGDSDLRGDALRQRGYTSIALAEFENAFRDFDRAVALDAAPQELKDEITFQKAWLQYRTEDYASAAPAFTALYEANPNAPKAPEALFWAAESNYQQGRFGTSTQLFREYLRDFPSGDKVEAAHYALGWSHFRQGQYSDAAREFNTFLNNYRDDSEFVPYRTDAQMRLADSYYAMKRYGEAIRYYERLADSGEDYALYQIGQAHNNAGSTTSAISALRRLLQRSPSSDYREEAQYTLGYLYFQTQNYDQAIEEYNRLIRTYPRDPLAAKAQYGIGDAYYNDGQLEQAVQAYTKVLEDYPNSPFVGDAAAGVQYALLGLQDEERAAAVIDSFATANPNSPIIAELRFKQAEVKYQSGNSAEALTDFQTFLRQHPDSPQAASANYYIGTIYSEQGRATDAETALRRVVNASEGDKRAEAADELGQLLLQQGRNQEALEIYRRMEQLGKAAKARYGQGQALLALGRTAEAEALLADAAESGTESPDSLPSKLGLAQVYEQQGRTGEATRLYREVVGASRDETGAEALYHLGNLLLKQGNAQGAISELSRMETLYIAYPNWLAQSYLLQARAFRNLGENGNAARMYDRVIEEFRGTRYAEQATQEKANL